MTRGVRMVREFGGWGVVTVEILIVTVGIVIAFGLNSWWEGRRDGARELAHLRALYEETVENRKRLAEKEAFEGRLNERLLALIDLIRADPPPPSFEVMGAVAKVFVSRQFEPVTAAYDELVGTGGLALIRNVQLRREIVELATLLKSRQEEEFGERAHQALTAAAVGKLGVAEWGALKAPTPEAATRQASRWNFAPLLKDAKFQDLLIFRQLQAADLHGYYREIGQRTDGLLSRLAGYAGHAQ